MIGVHDRTIRRYISEGKLQAKKEGRYVLINIDSVNDLRMTDHTPDHTEDHTEDHIQTAGSKIVALQDQTRRQEEEILFLRDRIKELEQQSAETRKEAAEASQRHDTIVLQLTRQLEQSQRLLEYRQEPWYRRWFNRSKREGDLD